MTIEPTFIEFSLPWPPTVNHYYEFTRNRNFISRRGQAFRSAVMVSLLKKFGARFRRFAPDARLAITIGAQPPDARDRDLDNLLKAPLDAIQKTGMVPNDKQFDLITIRRGAVVKNGKLDVAIYRLFPDDEPGLNADISPDENCVRMQSVIAELMAENIRLRTELEKLRR